MNRFEKKVVKMEDKSKDITLNDVLVETETTTLF